jgi:hypothetical protein
MAVLNLNGDHMMAICRGLKMHHVVRLLPSWPYASLLRFVVRRANHHTRTVHMGRERPHR